MSSRLSPTRLDQQFPRVLNKQIAALPPAPALHPDQPSPTKQPSLRARAARLLIILSTGVAAALAWQSHGDTIREIIASSQLQLARLAPQTAAAEATLISATAPATSPDSQEIQSMLVGLAAVRESVDRLAAQHVAGQQQMATDIAALKAVEQDILDKISSAPPPRPAAAPARKPVLVPPHSSLQPAMR